jgi:hypothetical protein
VPGKAADDMADPTKIREITEHGAKTPALKPTWDT